MTRLVVLLVAAVAALALAPTGSAAIAREDGVRVNASPVSSECSGPCPTVIVFKGPGSGRLESTPASDVNSCASPWLCVVSPDNEALRTNTLVIHPRPGDGSYFDHWERCHAPYGRVDGANCVLDISSPDASFTLCAVFNVLGRPAVPETECPPPTPLPAPPPPPPPPPSGPPPLGSRCTIPGTAAANVINGTSGRDVICGRGGNDIVNGRGGHDLILGGAGADRLTGGSGRDSIYGGSGTDTLYARDGARDTVNGGLGRDRARWDARDVRRSIERRF